MSTPLIGASPEQQLEQLRQAVIAHVSEELAGVLGDAERARTLARSFYNDVSMRGAGPAVVLEQKRSPLDVVPQVIIVPGALLLRFAASVQTASASQELAGLGMNFR